MPISKEVIISFETISERSTSTSFHEPCVKLVMIDMIGTFLVGELIHMTWIAWQDGKQKGEKTYYLREDLIHVIWNVHCCYILVAVSIQDHTQIYYI